MKKAHTIAAGVVLAAAVAGGWYVYADQGEGEQAVAAGVLSLERGRELYLAQCASCHGRNLEGQGDWRTTLPDGTFPAPPHDETGHTWHHPDAMLFAYTKLGGAAMAGGRFESGMPAFGDVLSDAEIIAVLDYIKSTWPAEVRQRQASIDAGDR
ncbi:MAG: cytochrome c [Geminicoccaceae bacterium]|nr:cytochrome c [Geminicoccaceae bacterium]